LILQIFLLIIGFIILIKGADVFVDGASSTAQNFKVSKILIGLTIGAFGTSAPELAVSIQSLAKGSTDMVLGNVIGSNITNILLILGVAAIIHPITVKQNTVKKELPLCFLISSLLAVLFLDIQLNNYSTNTISRSDALAILLFFAVFLYYIISISRNKIDFKEEPSKYKTGTALLLTFLGLISIVLGSNLVVDSATHIAKILGVSERIISLTIIALGTSLPELVTTITSSLKKEQDILLGNIIGSNIFNICIVLGIPVAIFGSITPSSFQMIDVVALLLSSFILFFFAKTQKKITKLEGIILISLYLIYYLLVFVL
jgi:cation:H+ antiporter